MKKIIALYIVLLIISCVSDDTRVTDTVVQPSIFLELDREVEKNDWGMNNKKKAEIFESIYNEHKGEADFIDRLTEYVDTPEEYYWIGIYLDSDYYTDINNPELSLTFLTKGLSLLPENDAVRIAFYYVIGKKLYYQGKSDEAVSYLVPGYLLSKEYPGHVPAWNSEEEYEAIMQLITDNLPE